MRYTEMNINDSITEAFIPEIDLMTRTENKLLFLESVVTWTEDNDMKPKARTTKSHNKK